MRFFPPGTANCRQKKWPNLTLVKAGPEEIIRPVWRRNREAHAVQTKDTPLASMNWYASCWLAEPDAVHV